MTCRTSCTEGWFSSYPYRAHGKYHADAICKRMGYRRYAGYRGNCGTTCGYCNNNNNSCRRVGSMSVTATNYNCGSDANGGIICNTVMWRCTY
jgi:hypothetical protein